MNADAFRLKRPIAPEEELHEAVAKALTFLVKPPAMWSTFPAGHVQLPAHAAARLVRCGLKRGWPDIILIHQGRPYGLELKREGGRLSRTYLTRVRSGAWIERVGQADVFPRLEAAGMLIAVCASVDEVLAALRGWGVPLREAAS